MRTQFTPPCGPITGWFDRGVVRASGIPYAVAERFEQPSPAPDHTEPLAATAWSPACPQAPVPALEEVLGGSIGPLGRDERCQNLTVTLPADLGDDESLPVMVWIHGGSYTSGAGDAPIMDPRPIVAEQRVIVVSVTYRLGLFGYLGGWDGRPANLGLLDQIEAFRWVQRNIAAFGGDPERVTAFGQSAGGDAVAHIMATPGARALFRRAIIQSAPLGIAAGRRAMTEAMIPAATGIAADTPADDVVALQREVAAKASGFGLTAAMPFATQYGYAPLPSEDSVGAAWEAAAPGIDILIGHTREEMRLFVPKLPLLKRWSSVPVIGRPIRRLLVGLLTSRVYGAGARRFARRHTRAGGTAHRYLISWSAPGNPFGSAHTVDLPLLFGDEATWAPATLVAGAPWSSIDADGRRMRALWADFARGNTLPRRGRIPGVIRYRRA